MVNNEITNKVEIEWRGTKVAVNMGRLKFGHHYLAGTNAKKIPILDISGTRILKYETQEEKDNYMFELWIIVLALKSGDYDKTKFPPTFENVFFLDPEEGKKLYEYYLKNFGKKEEKITEVSEKN